MTKEIQQANVGDLTLAVKELLKEHLVGITEQEGENVLKFSLAGGQSFRIIVEEV